MTEFKVGDWVKFIKGKTKEIARVEITEQIPNYIGISTGDNIPIEECELWKPSVGEWCWFYNVKSKSARLAQFKAIGMEIGAQELYKNKQSNHFKLCEPFIGQLPTFFTEGG